MRANLLLKHHIDELLRKRHMTRKDLAQWCHRTEGWISKIMRNENREFPLKYLDRIADFFGMMPYQLFQPGITRMTERRVSERRTGKDRRVMASLRTAADLGAQLDNLRSLHHGPSVGRVVSAPPPAIQSILADAERRIATYYEATHATGRKDPPARPRRTRPPAGN